MVSCKKSPATGAHLIARKDTQVSLGDEADECIDPPLFGETDAIPVTGEPGSPVVGGSVRRQPGQRPAWPVVAWRGLRIAQTALPASLKIRFG